MDNRELYHWGIKGMKWGVRRFQNKDGSLTPEGRKRYGDDDPNETTDQKRERLLKSTNAQELYKNRNLLTTNEINDRLNRINTEQRLADLAAKDIKSGYDRVDKMLKLGRKINEVYEFTNTPVMKALKKQLGLDKAEDTVKKAMGVDEVLKKWDKVSDDDVVKALKRANNKKALEKLQKEARDAKDAIKKDLDKESDKEDDKPSAGQNGDADSTPKNNTQTGNWKTQPFVKPNPKSEQEKVNEARDNKVDTSADKPISKGILYDRTGNEILNQFTDTKAVDIPTATVDNGKKYTDDFLKNLRSFGHADESEGELYHYGVLGMKWGIRRYQNKDGSLTPKGKQHLAENRIRTADNLTEKTIPKGTKMYRTTPDEKDVHGSKTAYVTYLDVDRDLYKEGSLVKKYVNREDQSEVYEHEFELAKDIRIPSLKTVRDIETELMGDYETRKEVGQSWMKSVMLADGDTSFKEIAEASKYVDRLDKASETERRKIYEEMTTKLGPVDGDYTYYTALDIVYGRGMVSATNHLAIEQSLGQAKNTKQAIMKELQKLGYNAMYDNASIGVGNDGNYTKYQEGIEPLIIFDAKNTLKETSTKRISENEQRESSQRYNQWREEQSKLLRKFK